MMRIMLVMQTLVEMSARSRPDNAEKSHVQTTSEEDEANAELVPSRQVELLNYWEWHENNYEVNPAIDRFRDEKGKLQAVAFPFDQGIPSSMNRNTSPNAQ